MACWEYKDNAKCKIKQLKKDNIFQAKYWKRSVVLKHVSSFIMLQKSV